MGIKLKSPENDPLMPWQCRFECAKPPFSMETDLLRLTIESARRAWEIIFKIMRHTKSRLILQILNKNTVRTLYIIYLHGSLKKYCTFYKDYTSKRTFFQHIHEVVVWVETYLKLLQNLLPLLGRGGYKIYYDSCSYGSAIRCLVGTDYGISKLYSWEISCAISFRYRIVMLCIKV
jgi:hypothetical protein